VSAVVLNVVFNGVRKEREAKCAIHAAGQEFDGTAQASEAK
jgi:NCS2 family nucleobase:cation symporter-2